MPVMAYLPSCIHAIEQSLFAASVLQARGPSPAFFSSSCECGERRIRVLHRARIPLRGPFCTAREGAEDTGAHELLRSLSPLQIPPPTVMSAPADKNQATLNAFFRSAPPHKQAASSSSHDSGMAACMDDADAAPARKPAAAAAASPARIAPLTVPVVHSSLPFIAATLPPASAPGSGSSSASNSSQRSSSSSSSSSGRRRKRASDGEGDDGATVTADGMGDDPTLLAKPSPLQPTLCKLPARTLLYQLHLLRSDEKMVVKGVDTRGRVGGGVEMVVRSTAEEDAASPPPPAPGAASKQEEETKSSASLMYAAALSSSSSSSASASAWMLDERKEFDESESSNGAAAAAAAPAAEEEVLEPLSSTLAPVSHPLFPDSIEFVSLFLDSASAHRRFQELAKAWREKGVRDVRARVVEFQTTGALQLVKVENEEQRKAWMSAPQPTSGKKGSTKAAAAGAAPAEADGMELEASMSGAPGAASAMPVASPVRTSFFAKRSGAPSSSSSSSASAIAAPAPAAPAAASAGCSSSSSAAAASSLPSLYTAPTVPAPLRSVLDSREDSVAGFCVNSALGASSGSVPLIASLDVVSSSDLSASSIAFGEVILRGSVCASSLHMLDDDKKGRWSQQLLTDLFGKMNMGKQADRSSGASSSSSSASSMGPRAHSNSSSAAMLSPSPIVQLAPSSFAPHLLSAHVPAAGHR